MTIVAFIRRHQLKYVIVKLISPYSYLKERVRMKEILIKRRKNISKYLIGSSILSLIFYFLLESQQLSDFDYSLHEIMALPYQLFLYMIPLLLLFWIYYSIRTFSEIDLKGMYSKQTLINLLASVVVILIVIFQVTRFYGVNTGGVFSVKSKWNDGEKYYIVLNDKNIQCTRNEYNLINEKDMYSISFEWNKLKPAFGYLESIEHIDIKVAD